MTVKGLFGRVSELGLDDVTTRRRASPLRRTARHARRAALRRTGQEEPGGRLGHWQVALPARAPRRRPREGGQRVLADVERARMRRVGRGSASDVISFITGAVVGTTMVMIWPSSITRRK